MMNDYNDNVVSFDTAKLLQERGFSNECNYIYVVKDGVLVSSTPYNIGIKDKSFKVKGLEVILAPTSEQTLSYFRTLNKCYPVVIPVKDGWIFKIYSLETGNILLTSETYPDYNIALNKSINVVITFM